MFEENPEEEKETLSDELPIEDEAEEAYEPEVVPREEKSKTSRHSLEVRRAIEDHLERLRLQEEVDYLYDEDFGTEEEP